MNISNMLQGEKIRLTAVTNEDVAAIVSWYEDTGFSRMFDATPARPRSKDFWLNWLRDQEKKSENFLFAIRPRNSSALIGYVQLEDF
ncbi:MAG: GNAT family N-acetyltransferase, partial [Planctomycetota bacterium]